MTKIIPQNNLVDSPEIFERLISANKSVICDLKGNFKLENCLVFLIKKIVSLIFRDLFGWEARKQVSWAKGLVTAFDQLEQQRCEMNREHYSTHLKTAKTVKSILRQNKSPNVKLALSELKLRTTALKYRLGGEYSEKYALQPTPDSKLFEEFKSLVQEWKKTQIVFKTEELSPAEIKQLETLTQYPKFATLVKDNPTLREKFFDWAFLTKNNVHAFVQFPKTVEKLMQIGLAERIGRFGGEDLQIEEGNLDGDPYCYKDLTLSFEGKRHTILDEKHIVTLSYDYKLAIGEVFKIFEDRKCRMGNVEYFGNGQGITNWNSNEWGAFNPAKNDYERIDMNDPDCFKKVPFTEVISEEEALNRFEDKDGQKLQFGPKDWVFTIIANNQYKHANLTGTHTMFCMAVPLENGKRGICHLGKFAWEFPDAEKEKLKYLRVGLDTVRGAIQLPDENIFQMRRDSEGVSWAVGPEEAQIILNKIRKDKKRVEEGAFFFQFLVYNCTDWAFKKLRRLMTPKEQNEIAEMSMWDAKPEGLIACVIKLPPKLRRNILHLCIKIARPEGKVNKRKDGTDRTIQLTTKNAPWNEGVEKVHPAMLILRKREKKARLFQAQVAQIA